MDNKDNPTPRLDYSTVSPRATFSTPPPPPLSPPLLLQPLLQLLFHHYFPSLGRSNSQNPNGPIRSTQHDQVPQRSKPHIRQLSGVSLEQQRLLPSLVLEHPQVGSGASEELPTRVEPQAVDLSSSGSGSGRESDGVKEESFLKSKIPMDDEAELATARW